MDPKLYQWWRDDIEEGRVHEALIPYVRALEEDQADIHEEFFQAAWLYQNSRVLSPDGEWREPLIEDTAITTNLIESAVDTGLALIARNHPRVTIQTDGADYSTRKRAKKLEKYVEAEFHRMEVYEDAVDMFRDAEVEGTGVLKVVPDKTQEPVRPSVERVLIDQIIVDERACRSAPPRTLHERHFMDREQVKALYPDADPEIIDRASTGTGRFWTSYRQVEPTQVPVVEAWHLPSKRGAGDGKHCICIEGADLFCESWTDDEFPHIFFRWSKRMTGFYGRGLVAQLAGTQGRINHVTYVMAKGQELVAIPRGWVLPGDSHLKDQINNDVGSIYVTKTGKGVTWQTGQAFGTEIYQYRKDLIREGMEFVGISQSFSQGQKPGGVESAVAIREVSERESGRFAIQAQRYESVFLVLARKVITLQKKLGTAPTAVWKSRNLLKKINWSDVDMDEDMYMMSLEAASMMSRTPAGRMQAVIELAQANLLHDRAEARQLLGHPDLERSKDLATAAREDIELTIETLGEEDEEFPTPEPYQDLKLGLVMVQQELLRLRGEKAPPEILQRFRDWLALAQNLLAPPPPPAAPGMNPAGMPVPGALPPGTAMSPISADAPGAGAVPGMSPQAMALSPDAMGLQPY